MDLVRGDLEILHEQESRVTGGYTFYRPFSPDKLVRNKIFSSLDLHPCSIRRSGTPAGGGLEGIYSVIAESVFYFILSSNHWPEVAYELR